MLVDTTAIVLEAPEQLVVRRLPLVTPGETDVVVDVEFSAVSTGTERLLWTGRMPPFPGMGYPLVPGYESVGRVVEAGRDASVRTGDRVFVPGASCFGEVRGLFGGAASRLVVSSKRLRRIDETLGEQGVLLALAATAHHAIAIAGAAPELIVGHGVLGRLVARLVVAAGGAPTVWEISSTRSSGARGYEVVQPDADPRRDYASVVDVSGDPDLLDTLVLRLTRGGRIVLAGFPDAPVTFSFAPAFMKEAQFAVAAEWTPADLDAVIELVSSGKLDLDGLITHRRGFGDAPEAYRTAFTDPACLKMLLDWRSCS